MSVNLYIDDIRDPKTDRDWAVVRSSHEAIQYFHSCGCPDYISFDHDLGGDDTSMIIVKWMIEEDLNENGEFIPENFQFNVHSANPVGVKNIEGLMNSYMKERNGRKEL